MTQLSPFHSYPSLLLIWHGWDVVTDAVGFTAWERAWQRSNGRVGVLRPERLGRADTTFVAVKEAGRIVAGAIFNQSTDAVGIFNFFVTAGSPLLHWQGCVEVAGALFPGTLPVSYSHGPPLRIALATGFKAIGPLRVWVRDNA